MVRRNRPLPDGGAPVIGGAANAPGTSVVATPTVLRLAPPKLTNDFFAFGGADAGKLRNAYAPLAVD